MKYKNKVTNEVRDFSCTLTSKVWERVEEPSPISSIQEESPKKKRQKQVKDDELCNN